MEVVVAGVVVVVVVVMEVVYVLVVAAVEEMVTEDSSLCLHFEIFFYEFGHVTGYVRDVHEYAEVNVILSGKENG